MRVPYFRVSAFTNDPFGGNPAGVCALEKFLPDEVMQKIAAENGLSEADFLCIRASRQMMFPPACRSAGGHPSRRGGSVEFLGSCCVRVPEVKDVVWLEGGRAEQYPILQIRR
jgi:hypothetical protein